MSERPRLIATDWDGTFTDPVAMEETYRLIVAEYLSQKIGVGESQMCDEMQLAVAEVLRDPASHAWTIDGRVVAYPTDHLRVVQEAAMIVLKALEVGGRGAVVGEVRSKLYYDTAPKVATIYKADAREILIDLLRQVDVVVITNSGTEKVSAEVGRLLNGEGQGSVLVRGDANKFMIDPTFTSLPDGFRGMYGFPNPVHLRQRRYFNLLVDIFGDLANARMMGDNGLLDLALVDYGDGRTGLVTSAFSMPWEKRYWSHLPRRMAGSLAEVAEWIVK